MKVFLAIFSLSAIAWGSPLHNAVSQSNNEQKGVFFVSPSSQPKTEQVTSEQVEEIMKQLRQEGGSDSGVYHIILPDGRLQRVQYTTAPVSGEQSETSVASNVEEASLRQGSAAILAQTESAGESSKLQREQTVPGPAALVSQSPRISSNAPANEVSTQVPVSRLFLIAEPISAEQNESNVNEAALQRSTSAAKYVASVQYTEVQPITGPIYSYNPQPLKGAIHYAIACRPSPQQAIVRPKSPTSIHYQSTACRRPY